MDNCKCIFLFYPVRRRVSIYDLIYYAKEEKMAPWVFSVLPLSHDLRYIDC